MFADKNDEKIVINLLILSIIITLIFISLVGYYGVLINNNSFCKKETYSDYANGDISNSSFILNAEGAFVVQKFYIEDKDIVKYSFCFDVDYDNNSFLEYSIIDNNETVYATDYIYNDTLNICHSLDDVSLNRDIYLGVRCNTCNESHTANIQRETLGNDVNQLFFNGAYIAPVKSDTLSYKLVGYRSCKNTVRWLFQWFIFTIITLWVGALILVGYKKFKEMLIDGFS